MRPVVLVAGLVHVGVVIAFLVALGMGVELRPLAALVGGIVASIAWLAALRDVDDVISRASAVSPRPAGRPVSSPPATISI